MCTKRVPSPRYAHCTYRNFQNKGIRSSDAATAAELATTGLPPSIPDYQNKQLAIGDGPYYACNRVKFICVRHLWEHYPSPAPVLVK